ncbi:MAG TPA: thermonuclease family protein [Ideonella sp.]|uniref:thermonuclease family protein n=1 Tax=Ideonella sp. TaxID=1929293 RepID=UPI002E31D5D2|nr:thermonuclease family protein [Ideonella sp.]HEX5687997.1 thermonuclease family protein [Ideonella sp.]
MKRLAASCLLTLFVSAPWATMSGRATYISDGDTLWVKPTTGGKPIKLRLQGIDAPEVCQPGGTEARDALKRLVAQRSLQVESVGRDAWGRTLARISIDHQDIGARLVQGGHAWSDGFRGDPGPYAAEEASARRAQRGLFEQAKPERPRDFRLRHGPCEVPQ